MTTVNSGMRACVRVYVRVVPTRKNRKIGPRTWYGASRYEAGYPSAATGRASCS